MKRYFTYLICTLFLSWGVLPDLQAAPIQQENEQLLQRADSLVNKYKETEALQLYEQVLEFEADNFEALCKASLLSVRIGNRFADDTRKGEFFNKAKAYALRAYVLQPRHAEANYQMALSLSHISLLSGPKQKLALFREIKSYLDAALAADAAHDKAWHLLGRWQYKMANLNFAEVAASRIFFASTPEPVSNEEAISSINKAMELNPNAIQYYMDLALIYLDIKERESCINVLEQALALELATKEELEVSRRCKLMLEGQLKKEQEL